MIGNQNFAVVSAILAAKIRGDIASNTFAFPVFDGTTSAAFVIDCCGPHRLDHFTVCGINLGEGAWS